MRIVLDASITLSWRFDDEKSAASDAVLARVDQHGGIVPSVWRLEVANALQFAARRGRVTPAYVELSLRELAKLDIAIDPETSAHAWNSTLALARANGLTLYEAAYLELALRTNAALASLDQKLRAAGAANGLQLLGV